LSVLSRKLKPLDYIVIGGDFNINLLHSNKDVETYRNILSSYNLHILNDKPTRVTKNSITLIDHIIVSCDTKPICQTNGVTFSDHMATTILLNIQIMETPPSQNNRSVLKRNFCEANCRKFLTLLQSEDWHELFVSST
jgi:hypothetical protein